MSREYQNVLSMSIDPLPMALQNLYMAGARLEAAVNQSGRELVASNENESRNVDREVYDADWYWNRRIRLVSDRAEEMFGRNLGRFTEDVHAHAREWHAAMKAVLHTAQEHGRGEEVGPFIAAEIEKLQRAKQEVQLAMTGHDSMLAKVSEKTDAASFREDDRDRPDRPEEIPDQPSTSTAGRQARSGSGTTKASGKGKGKAKK